MTTDALTQAARKASRTDPILIAGPTASGKSALALAIAEAGGGVIVNADALQVYANWTVLTARPGAADLARAAHALYGHVAPDQPYSAGHWLREVAALPQGPRPIIVGGTGLYFAALTRGLADIPPTPPDIRAMADERMAADGPDALLAALDASTRARIDCRNPARIQRAWEVLHSTGRTLADWQHSNAPPLLPDNVTQRFVIHAPPERLTPRIARRFDAMIARGALDEVRANMAAFDPAKPAMKAIGAAPLMAHLQGDLTLEAACAKAVIATRQYAKRQRTWFRARMADWQIVTIPAD